MFCECECEYCQADDHPRWNFLFAENDMYRSALEKACKDMELLLQADIRQRAWCYQELMKGYMGERQ